MLETNVRQRNFYESRFEAVAAGNGQAERAANRPTRAWTRLRRRLQRLKSAAGVYAELRQLHRTWLGDLRHARVLDLGCFTGNPLTLWLAESAAEYVGVDLSESAIAELNRKLSEKRLSSARAVAMDFLANDWPDGHFDVVYAHSVLHHFANIEAALAELCRVVKPGGIIITLDPLSTDPLNRIARAAYRPFQTDRDWEFPFTGATLRAFERYFQIEAVQGLEGAVKLAYPLLLVPVLEPIGLAVASRLRSWDFRNARSFGVRLNLCWHITMKLRCRQAVAVANGTPPITAIAGR
jgi:ubiquinone/menaquinone biosynthesis C-methylase UbiE